MNRLEESPLQRWKSLRIVAISLAVGCLGISPAVAYIVLGADDANPIGLGLMALVAIAVATIGVLIGLIKLIIEVFASEHF